MNDDIEKALKSISTKLIAMLDDASELEVVTDYALVDGDLANKDSKTVAKTVIKLDKDSTHIVPVKEVGGILEVDKTLLAIHDAHVQNAVAARQAMLDSLLATVNAYLA